MSVVETWTARESAYLQLLRNADDDTAIAKLLAPCPVMQLDAGQAVTDSSRARFQDQAKAMTDAKNCSSISNPYVCHLGDARRQNDGPSC